MLGFLDFSESVMIAIHSLIILEVEKNGLISTKEIATRIHSSEAHLSKIMQQLVRYKIVDSVRGPKGGFHISKDSKDLKLIDIYKIFDDPTYKESCHFRNAICSDICSLYLLRNSVNKQVSSYLEETTLYDLVQSNIGKSPQERGKKDSKTN